jgi:integrase
MPLLRAVPVMLSAGERATLKKRVRGAKTAYRDRLRAQIVLAAARGHPNARIAASLGISADAAGLPGREWAPRELRHSFVSLLSDARAPIESISRLVGHRSTMVTETVYRKQLRPLIEDGAEVMDLIFPPWPHPAA